MKTSDVHAASPSSGMTTKVKLVFTAIAAAFIAVGVLAIVTQSHTGYVRYQGIRTILGDDAVWFGKTILLVAVLPLLVWMPRRAVAVGLSTWWLALMVWLFGPLLNR